MGSLAALPSGSGAPGGKGILTRLGGSPCPRTAPGTPGADPRRGDKGHRGVPRPPGGDIPALSRGTLPPPAEPRDTEPPCQGTRGHCPDGEGHLLSIADRRNSPDL